MTMYDLEPAVRAATAVVAGVSDDDLTRPTPCTDWTVAAVLNHLYGLSVAFSGAAGKTGAGAAPPPDPAATPLPVDWRTSVPAVLAELARAWSSPAAWTGTTLAGGFEMTGAEAGAVTLDEVVLHGWDLATATGQDFEVDGATVAVLEGFWGTVPDDPEFRQGRIGTRVAVSADASRWHRVLGLSGRDPRWTPPPPH